MDTDDDFEGDDFSENPELEHYLNSNYRLINNPHTPFYLENNNVRTMRLDDNFRLSRLNGNSHFLINNNNRNFREIVPLNKFLADYKKLIQFMWKNIWQYGYWHGDTTDGNIIYTPNGLALIDWTDTFDGTDNTAKALLMCLTDLADMTIVYNEFIERVYGARSNIDENLLEQLNAVANVAAENGTFDEIYDMMGNDPQELRRFLNKIDQTFRTDFSSYELPYYANFVNYDNNNYRNNNNYSNHRNNNYGNY